MNWKNKKTPTFVAITAILCVYLGNVNGKRKQKVNSFLDTYYRLNCMCKITHLEPF